MQIVFERKWKVESSYQMKSTWSGSWCAQKMSWPWRTSGTWTRSCRLKSKRYTPTQDLHCFYHTADELKMSISLLSNYQIKVSIFVGSLFGRIQLTLVVIILDYIKKFSHSQLTADLYSDSCYIWEQREASTVSWHPSCNNHVLYLSDQLKQKLHQSQQRVTLYSQAAEDAEESREEAEKSRALAEARVLGCQRDKETAETDRCRHKEELQQLKKEVNEWSDLVCVS